MGNKIDAPKKVKKLTSAEARKGPSVLSHAPVLIVVAKKDRMARRKRGEEVFTGASALRSVVSLTLGQTRSDRRGRRSPVHPDRPARSSSVSHHLVLSFFVPSRRLPWLPHFCAVLPPPYYF